MTMLIVTDSRDLADALVGTLQGAGYPILTAADAQTGWHTWDTAQPALLLIDTGLPDQQGWRLCERIRRIAETPIVLLGSGDGRASAIRGLALGADDYLRLPFVPQELCARVGAILRRTRPDVAARARAR